MFKNPLKYQQNDGALTSKKEELAKIFQSAAQNAQVDVNNLIAKAQEIKDEETASQFMEILKLCAQGDEQGIIAIKSLFKPTSNKNGGKINDFVCKYGKGGKTCGCNKGGNIIKADDGYKFYDENGVALSDDAYRQLKPGRSGYLVYPTKMGNVAKKLNDMDNIMLYPGKYIRPIEQGITSFEIVNDADYPEGFPIFPASGYRNYPRAITMISENQPKQKPWNAVEIENDGGVLYEQPGGLTPMSRSMAIRQAMDRGMSRRQAIANYKNNKVYAFERGLRGRDMRNTAKHMTGLGWNFMNQPAQIEPIETEVEPAIATKPSFITYNPTLGVDTRSAAQKAMGTSSLYPTQQEIAVSQPVQNDPFSGISDEDLANRAIHGEFGNGLNRRTALGDRYDAVQKIINSKLRNSNLNRVPSNTGVTNVRTTNTNVQNNQSQGIVRRIWNAITSNSIL